MNKQYLLICNLIIVIIFLSSLSAQTLKFTSAKQREAGYEQRLKLQQNSLVSNVEFRSIGPTVMSGRVVDLDVDPDDPTHFYVAYASGGSWETKNNGLTFTPLFDNQPVMTIGDIAVDWNHSETIWIGSGENNSSRSSYSGNGIYKSADHGKTWMHLGMEESHHIGRIVIHPGNPDIVWIAAMGHLYSANSERGIYKTTDGGKTWQQTLYVDDNSGAIDLVMDPKNPDVLYASIWERTRRAWDFKESGKSSGIYTSTDGGQNWKLISDEKSGFPHNDGVGRIGLAVYPENPQIIYAFLDNQNHRKKEEAEYAITKESLRDISKADFLQLDADDLNDFLDRNEFPMEFDADTLFTLIKNDTYKPSVLLDYLADANEQLFDTPVIGGEVYRSDDGGANWQKTNQEYIDKFVYTYGYYFGEIRVSAINPDLIYLLGVPLLMSEDGGKSFTVISKENVHADHQAMWVNPKNDGHLVTGNDGGVNITYDHGESWFKANQPAVGQFYTVAVDLAEPYNVYGGLQDNGVWTGPSTNTENFEWHSSGHYLFKSLMGGDGMQVAIDTRDNNTVYTGYQFGYYYRINKNTDETVSIKPKHNLGERPYRFNWQTPIHLSKHNQDILYLGSQMLHRSMDKGDHWETVSGDLTQGGKKGDVPYGTLTTIHESPLKFGLIYVGSDDGLIHLTKDGGVSWQRISNKLPDNYWVSRVQASAYDEGTVYASLNGYRWDNFDALVYKSNNYGKNWKRIGKDLPAEPVNVIKEDPVNKNILYVGTDHGLYVSLDGGKSFMGMIKGMPNAPVHDLIIHPREKELVVGTHGRSIYIANVEHLQQLDEKLLAKSLYLFDMQDIQYNPEWGNKTWEWETIESEGLEIPFYCKTGGISTIKILSKDDYLLHTFSDTSEAGLNCASYDLSIELEKLTQYLEITDSTYKASEKKLKPAENGKAYLRAGDYTIIIGKDGRSVKQTFEIKAPKKSTRRKQKKIP
ncbi:MAG: glycosyl hydrolase [Calditrichaceae bacterium]|nr:glycosyl hydrolase [Calditrichaceae bacterium]